MTINIKYFVQKKVKNTKEWQDVKIISKKFYEFLENSQTKKEIMKRNIPGARSQNIEEVITPFAESIGFESSKEKLFERYKVKKLVPDYYLKLNKSGIIIEVERGQTTQNNAALKDLWKTHICQEADYLFLFVPSVLKQNETGKIQGKPFNECVNRLSTFFEQPNYTNVKGLVIYGY